MHCNTGKVWRSCVGPVCSCCCKQLSSTNDTYHNLHFLLSAAARPRPHPAASSSVTYIPPVARHAAALVAVLLGAAGSCDGLGKGALQAMGGVTRFRGHMLLASSEDPMHVSRGKRTAASLERSCCIFPYHHSPRKTGRLRRGGRTACTVCTCSRSESRHHSWGWLGTAQMGSTGKGICDAVGLPRCQWPSPPPGCGRAASEGTHSCSQATTNRTNSPPRKTGRRPRGGSTVCTVCICSRSESTFRSW